MNLEEARELAQDAWEKEWYPTPLPAEKTLRALALAVLALADEVEEERKKSHGWGRSADAYMEHNEKLREQLAMCQEEKRLLADEVDRLKAQLEKKVETLAEIRAGGQIFPS